MGNHAINKPGGDGAPTPWHQDEAYWDQRFDHHAISIWIPLQDVAEANGCMVFVPGSHHGEVLPHRLIHPDSHGLQLVDDSEPGWRRGMPAAGRWRHRARRAHAALRRTEPHRRRSAGGRVRLRPAGHAAVGTARLPLAATRVVLAADS